MSTQPNTFPATHTDDSEVSGVSLRALLLGLLLVVVLDSLAIYVRYIYHGSLMTYSHIPMAMLIGFTLMLFLGALISRATGVVLHASEWHL